MSFFVMQRIKELPMTMFLQVVDATSYTSLIVIN